MNIIIETQVPRGNADTSMTRSRDAGGNHQNLFLVFGNKTALVIYTRVRIHVLGKPDHETAIIGKLQYDHLFVSTNQQTGSLPFTLVELLRYLVLLLMLKHVFSFFRFFAHEKQNGKEKLAFLPAVVSQYPAVVLHTTNSLSPSPIVCVPWPPSPLSVARR